MNRVQPPARTFKRFSDTTIEEIVVGTLQFLTGSASWLGWIVIAANSSTMNAWDLRSPLFVAAYVAAGVAFVACVFWKSLSRVPFFRVPLYFAIPFIGLALFTIPSDMDVAWIAFYGVFAAGVYVSGLLGAGAASGTKLVWKRRARA